MKLSCVTSDGHRFATMNISACYNGVIITLSGAVFELVCGVFVCFIDWHFRARSKRLDSVDPGTISQIKRKNIASIKRLRYQVEDMNAILRTLEDHVWVSWTILLVDWYYLARIRKNREFPDTQSILQDTNKRYSVRKRLLTSLLDW